MMLPTDKATCIVALVVLAVFTGITAIGTAGCIWSAHWNQGHWIGAAICGFFTITFSGIAGVTVGVLLKDGRQP